MARRVVDGLPPSFHQSFLPERRHLSSILRLASTAFDGTVEAIAVASGIPTGKSSGKVVPHIKYAKAMGLLESSNANSGLYSLRLSPLGMEVQKEDTALHEFITQLMAHLMLGRAIGGAMVWHVMFGESSVSLGQQFSIEAATSFISSKLGRNSSIPGPLFSTYREESSLARSSMLSFEPGKVTRVPLPSNSENFWGIAFCWLSHWEASAPEDQQLALSRLEAATGFQEISGWTALQYDAFLSLAEDRSVARVDRQTGEPLVLRTASSRDLLSRIYSELV